MVIKFLFFGWNYRDIFAPNSAGRYPKGHGDLGRKRYLCALTPRRKLVMKTTLLVVGRTVERHFINAIDDYVQRIRHYLSFEMEVIPELKNTKSLSAEVQKDREGELILKALQPGDVVVLLDEGGREMRSIEFADYVGHKMNTVNRRLVFVIGGPYGFCPKVYAAANEKVSLSRMTFSHQMVRLVFVEQLYRAMTILNGGPYHHE